MTFTHKNLLAEIEAFLASSGMGESYFGKAAAKNSELVARLRAGRRVWPETEARVLSFIRVRREMARLQSNGTVRHRGQDPQEDNATSGKRGQQ